jgi:3-deoxy-D-manno-octulosonate 8-phosphate phosphatase (KDO 8-P phosphatase)
MSDPNIDRIAAGIKLLLMDVDGVMTDGRLYHVPNPSGGGLLEMKGFDTQDGMALQWLAWSGVQTGVISGRVSAGTEERCRQCGCTYIYQGHVEKIPILEEIFARSGFSASQTAYVGDDLTDVVIMRRVALAIAPANARPEVKSVANSVTAAEGGHGAIREVCELLLKAQGNWSALLKKYGVVNA